MTDPQLPQPQQQPKLVQPNEKQLPIGGSAALPTSSNPSFSPKPFTPPSLPQKPATQVPSPAAVLSGNNDASPTPISLSSDGKASQPAELPAVRLPGSPAQSSGNSVPAQTPFGIPKPPVIGNPQTPSSNNPSPAISPRPISPPVGGAPMNPGVKPPAFGGQAPLNQVKPPVVGGGMSTGQPRPPMPAVGQMQPGLAAVKPPVPVNSMPPAQVPRPPLPPKPSNPLPNTSQQPMGGFKPPAPPAANNPNQSVGRPPISSAPSTMAMKPTMNSPLTPGIQNRPPAQPMGGVPPRPLSPPGQVNPSIRPLPPAPQPGGIRPLQSQPAGVPPKGPTPPGAAPVSNSVPPSNPVRPQRSILRFLPILVIVLVILGLVGYLLMRYLGQQGTETPDGGSTDSQKTVVTYWGLWEPTTVMEEVISEFEKQNPDYDIQYVQQNHAQYRERLQTAIAQGQGPDLFRFHASWVPMMRNELSALPERVMSPVEYQQTFYPVAQRQLNLEGNIVGIPLMYEGLGLYYNTQIFQVANVTPPKDWEELKTVAQTLTIRSGSSITRAGIALGTSNNVEHASDILGLMLYQNKRSEDLNQHDLSNVSNKESQDALDFYTSFSRDLNVWNASFPNATETFARGDVAMMIAPSWRAHEIKAKNPNITFAVAPLPQISGGERVAWASYWAEGVSEKSSNKEVAWNFLKYVSSADVQKKLHSDAKKQRAFGELYSRVDLASEQLTDPVMGAYLEDAPYAKSWYMNGYTHDNGINDRINKYYQDAINEMNQNRKATDVLPTVQLGIQQVLQQFGLAVVQ